LPADRPGRENAKRILKFPENWKQGQLDERATTDLLATLRSGSQEDACNQVVELLQHSVAPQSIWDALFLGAGELLVRQPGIVSLHAVTSTNALHFAYTASTDEENRKLLLLQNAAFLPMFRGAMEGRGKLADFKLTDLEPGELDASGAMAVERILSDVSSNPMDAARETLTYMAERTDPAPLVDAARLLVFLKGNDAHDYKFSSAVLEDYRQLSPAWRNRYLAASMFHLNGAGERDNELVQRTRAALGA
jgi:hypothetical protein